MRITSNESTEMNLIDVAVVATEGRLEDVVRIVKVIDNGDTVLPQLATKIQNLKAKAILAYLHNEMK